MRSFNPLLLAAIAVLSGCQGQPAKSSADASPAKVAHIANEEQLNTIVLSESAAKRLGIEIARTEHKKVARTRIYGGEVMTPPGASILV